MIDPTANGVVRDLRRSRAIFAELLPTLSRQSRASKAALDALAVLYPDLGIEDGTLPDLDQVDEWVIVGRSREGLDVATLSVRHLKEQNPPGRQRSAPAAIVEDLVEGVDGSMREARESSSDDDRKAVDRPSVAFGEQVEIRTLSDWVLGYLTQHPGEHFSVRRLRECAIEQLDLAPEQVEHDRLRLALFEARTLDPAIVQPNRKAWMYRRGLSARSGDAE